MLSGLNLEKCEGLRSPGTTKTVRIKRVFVKRGPTLIMTSCFSFSSTGRALRATKQPHALFDSALLGSHG